MYIDFHTHILPGIDDGAKDIQMSEEMLSVAKGCGAKTVILTPHVDVSSDFDKFLSVRNEKYNALRETVDKNPESFPRLLCGAEVLLDTSLSECENVRSLCIENTELLLLELPYTNWNSWYSHEVHYIMKNHGVIPVFAHIERYLNSVNDIKKLEPLISLGAKFQVNASSFLSFSKRRIIRELASSDLISAIASDAHNLTYRSPDIAKALRALKKKIGPDFVDYIYQKTSNLLTNYSCK